MRRITALLATTLLVAGSTAAFAGPPGAPGAPPPISPPRLALLGQAPAVQPVEFEVVLPLRNPSGLDALLAAQQDPTSAQYHRWLTPAEFAERFGPGTAALNSVAATLRLFGMQVTVQSRSLHVLGSAAQANLAFNLNLSMAANTRGQHRLVTTRPITLPATLSGAGALVPAFSQGAFEAAPMIHRAAGGYIHRAAGGYGQGGAGAGMPGYFYNDLKQAYGYPSYQATIGQGRTQRLDGTGANVAIIMASDVLDSDITAVFDAMQFKSNAGQSADPALAGRRSVNGGAAFSAANPASEEATLDVEQVLGGAPGAGVFLYDTPDLSDQSLISAYTAIVNDNLADVVSLSLGQCELYYTAQYNNGVDQTSVLHLFSELFKQGNAQGITFVAASGDAGGLGCVAPGYFAGATASSQPACRCRLRTRTSPPWAAPTSSPLRRPGGRARDMPGRTPGPIRKPRLIPSVSASRLRVVSGVPAAASRHCMRGPPISRSSAPARLRSVPFPTWRCRWAAVRTLLRRPAMAAARSWTAPATPSGRASTSCSTASLTQWSARVPQRLKWRVQWRCWSSRRGVRAISTHTCIRWRSSRPPVGQPSSIRVWAAITAWPAMRARIISPRGMERRTSRP